jgi:hypothetical protein
MLLLSLNHQYCFLPAEAAVLVDEAEAFLEVGSADL